MAGTSSIAFSGTEDNYLASKRITVPENPHKCCMNLYKARPPHQGLSQSSKKKPGLEFPFSCYLNSPHGNDASPCLSQYLTVQEREAFTKTFGSHVTFLPSAAISGEDSFSKVLVLNKSSREQFRCWLSLVLYITVPCNWQRNTNIAAGTSGKRQLDPSGRGMAPPFGITFLSTMATSSCSLVTFA